MLLDSSWQRDSSLFVFKTSPCAPPMETFRYDITSALRKRTASSSSVCTGQCWLMRHRWDMISCPDSSHKQVIFFFSLSSPGSFCPWMALNALGIRMHAFFVQPVVGMFQWLAQMSRDHSGFFIALMSLVYWMQGPTNLTS